MELDNRKKLTNEVVSIGKKTAQKETPVLMKMPIKFAQLLNTVSCSSEAEVQKQHWHCSISEQNGVQDEEVSS